MNTAIKPTERRSLRNLLVDSNFQFRFALYFAAAGLGAMSILFAVIMGRLSHVLTTVSTSVPQEILSKVHFQQLFLEVATATAVTLAICALILFGFAFYMSHRVAGAARAIESYIKEISIGTYDPDRQLRKSDDLQGIMSALRELAAKLRSRQPRP